jgi:hypothetical protein
MKISKLHYKYIIVIESLIILFLVTHICAPDATITQYVAFAATISSLILATLAIIQGFFSNYTNENLASRLGASSNQIASNSEKLTNLLQELDAKITSLPQEFETRLSTQIGNLGQQISGNQATKQEIKSEIPDTYFENYVMLGSVNGLLLLYAIELSIKYKRPFRLIDLIPPNQSENVAVNMQGYLVSHYAAGFVDYSLNGEILNFKSSAIDAKHITNGINAVVTHEQNTSVLQFFLLMRNHIENYFILPLNEQPNNSQQ